MSHVNELRKSVDEIELKILRGTGPQLVEYMKSGEAELAIAASIGDAWDRLDTWKLFDESFDMVFSRAHRLASHEHITLDDLKPERFLLRSHCEKGADLAAMLRTKGLNADHRHEVSSDQDLLALLEANIGIGFLPRTVNAPQSLVRTLGRGHRTRPHGLSLWRRRAPAHAGRRHLHEDAARRQLAAQRNAASECTRNQFA